MFFSFSRYFIRIFLSLFMLLGFSAQAQDMANGGVSVGWYQQTSVTLLDGRVEVWWLENGQPRRFWQWSPNSNSWSGTEAWWGDFLYNFTLVRRKDGLLEIAGLGNDRALYVKTQNTIYGDWGPWVQRIPPSTSGSAWQHIRAKAVGNSIQYAVIPFGSSEIVHVPELVNNGNELQKYNLYMITDPGGNVFDLYLNSYGQLTLNTAPFNSPKYMDPQYYKGIRTVTVARRRDGLVEIAAIGGKGQLLIKTQVCLGCDFSPWQIVVYPALNNSAWTSLQVAAEGFGLRYTLKTADPACSATYMDGEGARGCNASGFDRSTGAGEYTMNGFAVGWNQPLIIANKDGRLEKFYLLSDYSVYHEWKQSNSVDAAWDSKFEILGGMLFNMTVARRPDGNLEIAGLGGDRALHTRTQIPNSGWGPWKRVLGASVNGSSWESIKVSKVSKFDNRLKYELQTFKRDCIATYVEGQKPSGCGL